MKEPDSKPQLKVLVDPSENSRVPEARLTALLTGSRLAKACAETSLNLRPVTDRKKSKEWIYQTLP